jgi:hypothetical protein
MFKRALKIPYYLFTLAVIVFGLVKYKTAAVKSFNFIILIFVY